MITMNDRMNVDFCDDQMACFPSYTSTTDECPDKFQQRRSSQTIAGNFRLSSSCSTKTVAMFLLGSLVWYGVVIVTSPSVLRIESAMANGVVGDLIRKTPSTGAMEGVASEGNHRLVDLERLVARIETRTRELERRNRELELALSIQDTKPHLEQLVEQLERGLSVLFPEFSGTNPTSGERTTEKRVHMLRDYLSNKAAEFDPATLGQTLGQLTEENANLKTQVEELKIRLDAFTDIPNNLMQELQRRDFVGERARTPDTRKSAFSVASSQSQLGLQGQAQVLNFDYNLTNKGGDFCFNNNSFVCRVPGFYFFSLTLQTFDHLTLGITLMKNDDAQVYINTDQSGRSVSSTQTTILRLSLGDVVWLRVPPSDNYGIYSDAFHYTTFTGFLVFNTNT